MKLLLSFYLTVVYTYLFSQASPELRFADKVRIREAITISAKFGDQLFTGYRITSFAVLLVTDSTEFLIYHPNSPSDFQSLGKDPILNPDVYYRKAQFSPQLLATFPVETG
jgi:hypothetical protein